MANKIFIRTLLLFFVVISNALVSCGNDEPNGGGEIVSYLTGKYTTASESNKLVMTLNGVAQTDKEVYFKTDLKTATITLYNVIAGQKETVISNVVLTSDAEKTKLSFSGTADNITYSGNISMGTLKLDLTVK